MSGTIPSSRSTVPGSWRTWREAPAIRNSSSTLTDANSGRPRSRPASSAAGSGSSHSSRRRSAGIRRSASAHDAASKTYQSRDVAMREHVLDVVGERPQLLLPHHVDGGGRDDLVVVVDQLQQRFLDVARPRLEQHVAAPDLLLERQVLEHRHDPLAQLPGEDVVEVLGGAGAAARVAVVQRPLGRGDVLPRIDQREQPVDAVLRARHLLLQRVREQRVRLRAVLPRNRLSDKRQVVEVAAASRSASASIASRGNVSGLSVRRRRSSAAMTL